MIKNLLLIFFIFLLPGCSSYINNMHSKLDNADNPTFTPEEGKFDMYKQRPAPVSQALSSNNSRKVLPKTKRQYSNSKRVKVEDLRDNRSEGSLWYGNGQQNYFFSKNKNRRPGDIILIQVQGKLKKEIALELTRATPVLIRPQKSGTKDPKAAKPATQPTKEENTDVNDEKIYDSISGVVAEEINKEHILVKGRKDVLYKNRKRLIEILALVARRDVNEDDTIPSSKIIESAVSIVK